MSIFTMGSGNGVPVGVYQGEFVGIEETTNDYGNGIKWQWRIITGVHKDKTIQRITGTNPTPKNSCGKMLNALAGKTLGEGENFDPKDYVGKKFTVMVTAGENGGTRVETVAHAD